MVAAAAILALYGFARPRTMSPADRAAAAAKFKFERSQLPEVPGPAPRTFRAVSPAFKHIEGWISGVGASVALADLDSNGLPDDVCYVDTRTDQVIVAPAPGSPPRYAPFALDPAPLPYSASKAAPMGCRAADFNEDGWPDLLVVADLGTTTLWWNRGDGTFEDGTTAANADTATKGMGSSIADVNDDGHLDVFVTGIDPDPYA
ncbi:MAG TPA: VCBS repeat-containing protein, partial [Myxococcales bacterium]|nr:VCBS repeat-containing protein [Myxococcales bacterium]